MFPGCPEHFNTEVTLSEYSRNIATGWVEKDSQVFPGSFVKLLGKHFCRTPPSNHFSHDVVSFLLLRSVRLAA